MRKVQPSILEYYPGIPGTILRMYTAPVQRTCSETLTAARF